jgi:hypothetical protein
MQLTSHILSTSSFGLLSAFAQVPEAAIFCLWSSAWTHESGGPGAQPRPMQQSPSISLRLISRARCLPLFSTSCQSCVLESSFSHCASPTPASVTIQPLITSSTSQLPCQASVFPGGELPTAFFVHRCNFNGKDPIFGGYVED